jgi:hypothetical protein
MAPSTSGTTFVHRCRQAKIKIHDKRAQLTAFLRSLPGKPKFSQFVVTNPEEYAALAWAIQTCKQSRRWASLPASSAALLRNIFQPPGSTSQTSMSDLAKMWFQCIHESPEAPYPMLPARRLDDEDVTDDAQQGIMLRGPVGGVEPPVSTRPQWNQPDRTTVPNISFDDDPIPTFAAQARRSSHRTVPAPPSESRPRIASPDIMDVDVPLGRPSLPDMQQRLPTPWYTALYVAQNYGFQKLNQLNKAQTGGFYDALVLREPEWAFQAGFDLHAKTDYDPKHDGELLALAARFPLSTTSGAIFDDLTLDDIRNHWRTFETCLRSGAELSVITLQNIQIGVSAWFQLRSSTAKRDLANKGLDVIISAICRQENEVGELWRVYAMRTARDVQSLSTSERISATSTTYFYLLHPFGRAFLNAGQRDKIRSASVDMHQALGGSPPSTSLGPPSLPAPLSPPPPPCSPWQSSTPATPVGPPAYKSAFLGLPASSSIIGPGLAVFTTHNSKLCWHCHTPGHHVWECPRRYYERLREPCPGFDPHGNRDPSAWTVNGELQPHTRLAWKAFKARHGLVKARDVPQEPNF